MGPGSRGSLSAELLLSERPFELLASRLREQLEGAEAAAFELDETQAPGALGRTFGENRFTPGEAAFIRTSPTYPRRDRDPGADRWMGLHQLAAAVPGLRTSLAFQLFESQVMVPHGFAHYQRATLYDGDELIAHLSMYRDRRHPDFTPAEINRVQALLPAIQGALAARRRFGPQRTAWAFLEGFLADDDRPSWLFSGAALPLHANAAARAPGHPPLEHARRALVSCLAGRPDPAFRIVELPTGETRHYIVTRRCAVRRAGGWDLPPWLAAVADRVARGTPDKQIAAELGKPLTTVRTAVARIYGKLGVTGRADLAAYAAERGLLTPP